MFADKDFFACIFRPLARRRATAINEGRTMKPVPVFTALLVLSAVLQAPIVFSQGRDRFEQLDRNRDGRISADEAGNSKQFRKYDLNGDGFVTPEEIRAARGSTKATPSNRDADVGVGAYREFKNQQYAKISGVDPNLLSLDVYAPSERSAKKLPVLVMVHGGGWQKGDKSNTDIGPRKANFFVPMG